MTNASGKPTASNAANPRYLAALAFAQSRHGAVEQARKGTSFPYLVHPLRVAEILDRFGCAEDVVVAGLLHDTVEDADVSHDEILATFGPRVAQLVERASEPDKSLSWLERKRHTIERAKAEEDLEALDLIAADKLDNVRSLQETLRARGETETWRIFNADKKKQHWYYRSITETLLERKPTSLLMRTLDAEVHALFPDRRKKTRLFAGKNLGNPQDARAYLADPIKHWRPKYSAFELATAWLGQDGIPANVDDLLAGTYGDYELVEGFFEKQTELDRHGRPSQTDLLLLLRTKAGFVVVGIEAKAREPFGPLVSEWKGTKARLGGLCLQLGLTPATVKKIRYQLLHRTVATVLEARRYHAPQALMLVHSFDENDASFDDYKAFAAALQVAGADTNALTTPLQLAEVSLRLGWLKEN